MTVQPGVRAENCLAGGRDWHLVIRHRVVSLDQVLRGKDSGMEYQGSSATPQSQTTRQDSVTKRMANRIKYKRKSKREHDQALRPNWKYRDIRAVIRRLLIPRQKLLCFAFQH